MHKSEIIALCSNHLDEIQAVSRRVKPRRKGILRSEMLLVCSMVEAMGAKHVIESGRALGVSTEILARFFEKRPEVTISSVEYRRYSSDSLLAIQNLKGRYNNLDLLFGYAQDRLPELARLNKPCVVLIDGPKGKYAVGLAARLLALPQVRLVFIHDLYRGLDERQVVKDTWPGSFFSDDEGYVRAFSMLDEQDWKVYEGDCAEFAPFYRAGVPIDSYGPTLAMIPNSPEGFHDQAAVYRRLDVHARDVSPVAWLRWARVVRCLVPAPSELPNFFKYLLLVSRPSENTA